MQYVVSTLTTCTNYALMCLPMTVCCSSSEMIATVGRAMYIHMLLRTIGTNLEHSMPETMRLKITDLAAFKNRVFGADVFLTHFRVQLLSEGVAVEKRGDFYYMLRKDGTLYNDSCFFSEDEIKSCMVKIR